MNDLLGTVRSSIEDLYRQHLGVKLGDSLGTHATEPVYLRINQNDFLSIDPQGNAGLLLDAECAVAVLLLPYEDDDLMQDIQRAVTFASKLQPVYRLSGDSSGRQAQWHVNVLWLVKQDAKKDWLKNIAARRRASGFSEEIGLDVIFYNSEISQAVSEHGLPRLLLRSRSLLRKQADEMPKWLSANQQTLKMLEEFPSSFSDKHALRELAEQVVEEAATIDEPFSEQQDMPKTPMPLESIYVENFRNIKKGRIVFHPPSSGTCQAHVVFGPNGTGKSSLFEALSLSACGASTGLKKYLDDPEKPRGKPYLDYAVVPLQDGEASPAFSINGDSHTERMAYDLGEAKNALHQADGTLLSQETSHEFILERQVDLAGKILRSYSTIADKAQQFAEEQYARVRAEQQNFIRRIGERANISNKSTIQKKIAENVRRDEFPRHPESLVTWLAKIAPFFDSLDLPKLVHEWDIWRDQTDRSISDAAGTFPVGLEKAKEIIGSRLSAFNELHLRTKSRLDQMRPDLEKVRTSYEQIEKDLNSWSAWAWRQQEEASQIAGNEEVAAIRQKMSQARKTIQLLEEEGRELNTRKQHFNSIEPFLTSWEKKHADECPTCGADHSDQGGIRAVVESQKANIDSRLESLREDWKKESDLIKGLEAQLTSLNQAICPVSADRRLELSQLLAPLLHDVSLENIVVNQQQVQNVLQQLGQLRFLPTLPEIIEDVDAEATRIVEHLFRELNEAERVWNLPDKWKEVRDTLNKRCHRIVQEHLPETLQSVWLEILMALNASPWITESPKFDLSLKRGNEELALIVGQGDRKILARYFFNQAEAHTLGLAWFFTRYLIEGRFRYTWQAMDDPAQEMDQTTFRTFTRFLQSWINVHHHLKISYTCLAFLHQEDRALDFARATSGALHVLDWSDYQGDPNGGLVTFRQIKLLEDGFVYQQPNELLKEEY